MSARMTSGGIEPEQREEKDRAVLFSLPRHWPVIPWLQVVHPLTCSSACWLLCTHGRSCSVTLAGARVTLLCCLVLYG